MTGTAVFVALVLILAAYNKATKRAKKRSEDETRLEELLFEREQVRRKLECSQL
jgi:hypothetical protein